MKNMHDKKKAEADDKAAGSSIDQKFSQLQI